MDRITKYGNVMSVILSDVEFFKHLSKNLLSKLLTLCAAYETSFFGINR